METCYPRQFPLEFGGGPGAVFLSGQDGMHGCDIGPADLFILATDQTRWPADYPVGALVSWVAGTRLRYRGRIIGFRLMSCIAGLGLVGQ
jgi:hypothetical protein